MAGNFGTHPETKRTYISSGKLVIEDRSDGDSNIGSGGAEKLLQEPNTLERFALSRPFTSQLDVLVDSSEAESERLATALRQLSTRYRRARLRLTEVLECAHEQRSTYTGPSTTAGESPFIAVGFLATTPTSTSASNPAFPEQTVNQDADSVWSLDPRGVLTLAVGASTYQRLGIVGKPLPWRPKEDSYVIQISIHGVTTQTGVQPYGPKVKAALERWEAGQHAEWDVVYYVDGDSTFDARATWHELHPDVTTLRDIHVPSGPMPHLTTKNGVDEERWHEEVAALFEWVGMTCLGSQRLQVNDRCDPYIAVYEPPSPSRTADVMHLRWTGFLTPTFVQQVADSLRDLKLSAVTAQALAISPVTYIAPSTPNRSIVRAPREDSEDVWTLIMQNGHNNGEHGVQWVAAESIGKYDSRLG